MKVHVQGWRTTLLFVLMLGLGAVLAGCAGRAEVYTAGVRTQETQEIPDARMEETGFFGPDGGAEAAGSETAELSGPGGAAEALGSGSAAAKDAGAGYVGYVYVCGAVMQPGVYPTYEGMRVFEAIELAGGFAQNADREWLNQAELLQDGQRLYVYTQEETRAITEGAQADGQPDGAVLWAESAGTAGGIGAGGWAGSTVTAGDTGMDGSGLPGQKVNLNTADREQLKTLPGIGDAKADAILQYRAEHGFFGSIEEIQNISGIKSAVFSKIRDLITV